MGRQEGVKVGRQEGVEMGRERLLRDRFGAHPDIPALGHRLAGWPDGSAVHAITTATTLTEIADAQPPT